MNSKLKFAAAAAAGLALAGCSKPYAVAEKSVADLNADLAAGKVTSAGLTQAYIDRIKKEDKVTNSVLAINPKALEAAKASDERRKAGKTLGPLDGIPILIKDNID